MSSYVSFLYKIECNLQRDVKKLMVNTKARLKPNYLFIYFLTVSNCGCEYSITMYKGKETHQSCVVGQKPNIILKRGLFQRNVSLSV